jgi:ubiquinone/menaquinone biosynthesis C-methylase UbiE
MNSILDIGAANGWVFLGSGLNVMLLDINEFPPCEFPRLVMDAHDLKLEDGSFDCCVVAELLEHVHNPILVLREAYRVASKRLVITVPNETNWSKDHTPFATLPGRREREGREYYEKANPDCTKINDGAQALHNRVYDKDMLLKHLNCAGCVGETWIGTIEYAGWSWICATIDKPARELVKVNLGSFVDTIGGWENIDILPLADRVDSTHKFRQVDVRQGLPLPDSSVDLVNCSHLIEHLTLPEAHKLCGEIYRVLRPGGITRISTPDAKVIIRHFISSDMDFFNKIQPDEYVNAKTQGEKLSMLLYSLDYQHHAAYTLEMLKEYLEGAGFNKVVQQEPGQSLSENIKCEVADRHTSISLIVEAVK